jgi:allantoate deiminase
LVRAKLDVRHADDWVRLDTLGAMRSAAETFAKDRGVRLVWEERNQQPSVDLNSRMLAGLCAAAETAGHAPHRMVSGAGHDAMILARKVPAAMLFVRSPGGISHHPDEAVLPGDVEAALAVGGKFLERWRPA